MACIPVNSERDAFRIFETLNDRGLRLSVPDLLLNHLMRMAASDADRRSIRDLWNEMLLGMGRRDISRFLRHLWISKYGDLKNQDLFTALKDHLENKKIVSLEFARTCAEECEKYVHLISVTKEHLGSATPVVESLVNKLDIKAALPVLLSAYQSLPLAEFEKVCRWLLVFVMRYAVIANLDLAGLENLFFDLAREIRNRMGEKDASAGKCLAHIKAVLKKDAPSDKQLLVSMESLELTPEDAGYVISRLATRLQTDTKEIAIDEANIEHIFPKKPSSDWKNKEELEPYLWHVGNLIMLGERLNTSAASKTLGTRSNTTRRANW